MILDRSDMFKVLSADTRVRILELLKSNGPVCGSVIAERFGITPSAVSQHLKALRIAGLVTRQRQGYHVPYSLNDDALEHFRAELNAVCQHPQHARSRDVKLSRLSIDLLKKYERELRDELQNVREKVKKIEGAKK